MPVPRRKDGQNTVEDLKKRDLHEELEEKERKHFSAKEREREIQGKQQPVASGLGQGLGAAAWASSQLLVLVVGFQASSFASRGLLP